MARREESVEALEDLLRQLTWSGRKALAQELSYYGVTVPQFYALLSLKKHDRDCSMNELTHTTRQASATMTGVIDRLVKMGLVERGRKGSDRRVVMVGLTRRGEQLLEEVRARQRHSFHKVLAKFDDEEIDQLLRILEALSLTLSRAEEEGRR